MLIRVALTILLALGLVPIASAQEQTLEVPLSLFSRIDFMDGSTGTREWKDIDAKRILFIARRDQKIDAVEEALIRLLLERKPFTITSTKSGQPVSHIAGANLSSQAVAVLAEAIGKQIDTSPNFFEGTASDWALLSMQRRESEWTHRTSPSEIYGDVSAGDYVFKSLMKLNHLWRTYPSAKMGDMLIFSDAPPIEGDMARILADMSSNGRVVGLEIASNCALEGKTFSPGSQRILTQDAIDACLIDIFGSRGESYDEETLTRGHMIRQVIEAAEEWRKLQYK